MKIKTLTVYTFSFSNPDDVDILTNQANRLASQGYNPLFPPTLFNDTVIQQWGMEEDNERINSHGFRLSLTRAVLNFSKKWDSRKWAEEYEKFDEWLKNANSTWCSNKSANTLYRKFAIEQYIDSDMLKDGYCIKGRYK